MQSSPSFLGAVIPTRLLTRPIFQAWKETSDIPVTALKKRRPTPPIPYLEFHILATQVQSVSLHNRHRYTKRNGKHLLDQKLLMTKDNVERLLRNAGYHSHRRTDSFSEFGVTWKAGFSIDVCHQGSIHYDSELYHLSISFTLPQQWPASVATNSAVLPSVVCMHFTKLECSNTASNTSALPSFATWWTAVQSS